MKAIRIAVLSFPGNNCEVESIRAVKAADMEPVFFRWNDDRSLLNDIDGYFLPGGFSYEDRGRSGMVAARDPLMDHLRMEAEKGTPIIGNCNGAQILVESGLIPLGQHLDMSLARNVIEGAAVGFLNEWVWITPTCARDRCVTSDWEGALPMPIAHGEGRFTTKDVDLLEELKRNDQIAFRYCNEDGVVSEDPIVTPNGSLYAIAGICNPAGNVVAFMPHPERTPLGAPYFSSLRRWIERGIRKSEPSAQSNSAQWRIAERSAKPVEVFIDTVIVNNEERTVEQAARRVATKLTLKQLKYLAPADGDAKRILGTIALFNPNKEVAYIRRGGAFFRWDSDAMKEVALDQSPLSMGAALLRRDEPDTGADALGKGSETGVCYVCSNVNEKDLAKQALLEVFANPHASTLERMQ